MRREEEGVERETAEGRRGVRGLKWGGAVVSGDEACSSRPLSAPQNGAAAYQTVLH